jgi:hypothetical protein
LGGSAAERRAPSAAQDAKIFSVALLSGVTPRMQDRRLTAGLFGLLTTEARHASWARSIVKTTPAAHSFDEPRPLDGVKGVVARTHFIAAAAPRMTQQHSCPTFTG